MTIRNQIDTLLKSEIEKLTVIDTIALRKIKLKYRSPEMTRLMDTLTLIGTSGLVWIGAGLYMMRRKDTKLDGLVVVFGVGQNVVINNLVTKFIFKRERPCVVNPEEYMHNSFPAGYSFPSGHTLTSFTGATILTIADWRNFFWAFPLAVGIGFSRMYLYAHYPSDVLAGAVDGLVCGTVNYLAAHAAYNEDLFPRIERWIDRPTRIDRKDEQAEAFLDRPLSKMPVIRTLELDEYKKLRKEAKQEEKRKKREEKGAFFRNAWKVVEIIKVIRE